MLDTRIAALEITETPTLQLGATGAAVRDLQEVLTKRVGIGGLTVDGIFGPITELAVRVFQQRSFIEDDGIVGMQTWTLLLSSSQSIVHLPTLRRGDRGVLVERLQRALTLGAKTGPLNDIQQLIGVRGYYFGRIDGDFGPMTEQAVKDYQQNPRLGADKIEPVDGIVGPLTWLYLRSLVTQVTHHSL